MVLKKYVVLLSALVFGVVFLTACDNKESPIDLSGVESPELLQASQNILQERNGMQALLSMQGLQMQLGVSAEEDVEVRYANSDEASYDNEVIDAEIAEYFSELWFTQKINPPTATLSTQFLTYDFKHQAVKQFWETYTESEQGERNFPYFPKIKIDTLYYPDDTTSSPDLQLTNVEDNFGIMYTDLPNARYIQKADLQLDYRYPKMTSIEFDQEVNSDLSQGFALELDGITTSEIRLSLPDNVSDKLVAIQAFHANGKQLYERGSNSRSMPSKQMFAYFESVIPVYTQALKKVSKEKIKTAAGLQDFLDKELPAAPEDMQQLKFTNYHFAGPVARVLLHFKTDEFTERSEIITLQPRSDSVSKTKGMYIATDVKANKQGLVNTAGEWLAEPFADELVNVNEYFFMSRTWVDDPANSEWQKTEDKYYWVDTKSQKIRAVNFQLDDYEMINGSLFTIEPVTNGSIGVFDARSGKIIISMQYSHLNYRNGFFVAGNSAGSEIFTPQAKRLINKKFKSISVVGDYIYTTSEGEHFDTYDVYTNKGKRLTNGEFDIQQEFGKDGLMLVRKCKKEYKNDAYRTSECQEYYLDAQGKVAFDTSTYSQLNGFSNGLAAVKKSDHWGYINSKGKLAIPAVYKRADYFIGNYAYVEKNDKAYLIDKNNKVLKALPDTRQSATRTIDSDEARYNLYNGESYNALGELITQ